MSQPSPSHQLPAVDIAGLRRLAEGIAFSARPGDCIALHGDLGAGKTTFTRFLIQAMAPDTAEVPSPTFTLVQGYDTPRMPIAHFDLYRLRAPSELDELGFDDFLRQGLALVEWPDHAGDRLPADRLDLTLADCTPPLPAGTDADNRRDITLVGHGSWQPRIARLMDIAGFLVRCGACQGHLAYMQGDASTRRYAVLTPDSPAQADWPLPGQPLVLMDSPRQPDGPPVRDGLPYSRIAHLAEDVRPFVAIADTLGQAGLSVPRILAHDLDKGLLLLEHLGDNVFGKLVAEAGARRDAVLHELWRAGVDCLVAMAGIPVPRAMPLPDGSSYSLPPYDARAFGIETELLIDWYWPALKGSPVPADARAEFLALWNDVIVRLVALPQGWALRDYHSPNLLWMPQREGVRRVGIIDFQDAQAGPLAYDLVSLLQDARLDVPAEIETDLLDYYCSARRAAEPGLDEPSLRFAYAALGAQRNTKIVGIFARLARRDGKPGYLAHIPRIWRYLARDLAHPELAALRAWYDRHLPVDIRSRVLSA